MLVSARDDVVRHDGVNDDAQADQTREMEDAPHEVISECFTWRILRSETRHSGTITHRASFRDSQQVTSQNSNTHRDRIVKHGSDDLQSDGLGDSKESAKVRQ